MISQALSRSFLRISNNIYTSDKLKKSFIASKKALEEQAQAAIDARNANKNLGGAFNWLSGVIDKNGNIVDKNTKGKKGNTKATGSNTSATNKNKKAKQQLTEVEKQQEEAKKALQDSQDALTKGYQDEIAALDRKIFAVNADTIALIKYDATRKTFGKNQLKFNQQQIAEIVSRNKNIASLEAEKKKRKELAEVREKAAKQLKEQRDSALQMLIDQIEKSAKLNAELQGGSTAVLKLSDDYHNLKESEQKAYLAAVKETEIRQKQLDQKAAYSKQSQDITRAIELQTLANEQGIEAARVRELFYETGSNARAEEILQNEKTLDLLQKHSDAWHGVETVLKDALHGVKLEWTDFRDALLEPLTVDINVQIDKAAADITRGIASVFDGGGGVGDLINVFKRSVGGLFAKAGSGFGGAINSYQIGSGLAASLGASQNEQIGAGIGGAIGNLIPVPGAGIVGSFLGSLVGGLFDHGPKIRFNQSFNQGETAEDWGDGRNYGGESVFGRFGLDRASKRFYKLSDAAKAATEKMVRVAEISDAKIASLLNDKQIESVKSNLANEDIRYGNNSQDIQAFLVERLRIQLGQLDPALRNVIKSSGDYEQQLQAVADSVDIKEKILPLFEVLGAEIGRSTKQIFDSLNIPNRKFKDKAGTDIGVTMAEAEEIAQQQRMQLSISG